MRTIWQSRMVQATSKYGEHAPMAGVCCNACRTCATTNIASLALAGIGGAGFAVWAAIKRLGGRRSSEIAAGPSGRADLE